MISAAEYAWKQIAVNVVASGLEIRNNSGSKTRIINLVKSRMQNAIRSFKNGLSEDLYSDGTASNQIGGLQHIVADAGTGTVGGINSSTYTFWKNKVQSAASPLNGGAAYSLSSANFEQFMTEAYIEISRGMDQPDLVVLANNYWMLFEASQVSLKRYSTEAGGNQSGKAGFVSMKFKKADAVFDGGSLGGGISTSHGYMINTNFLELVVHRDANMTEVPEMRSVNQDAVVMPINLSGVTIH